MRLKMRLNANSLSISLWIFLVFSTVNLFSSRAQSATLSCIKSQSSQPTNLIRANLSEIDIDSRIESLATQALFIRWNQFSDPAQRLQAIHYFETESQNLQTRVPDLKQRLQKAMRRIKISEQERFKRKDEPEREKRDLIEKEMESINPLNIAQKMTFHEIRPGEFMMGEIGKQVKTEITKPFAMMATQVTQMMYSKLMVAMGERDLEKINPSHFKAGTDSITENIDGIDVTMKPGYPVESVSWNDLMESGGFIEGLNKLSTSNDTKIQEFLRELIPGHRQGDIYDLPSEAQWDFVMRNRGLANETFFDFDDIGGLFLHAVFSENSKSTEYPKGSTHAVATKLPRMIDVKGDGSVLPFYDLAGNVWEWSKDSWDGASKLPGGKDPVGTSGFTRVFLGGGWYSDVYFLRSGYRSNWGPEGRCNGVGFRLVRTRP